MKKLINVLEWICKLCSAVILMEITANAYIWISTGFRWSWTWTEYQDMIVGYPLILGAAWVAFHVDELWDRATKLFHKNDKNVQFVVYKVIKEVT